MAVLLPQMQSQPDAWLHAEPSHEPMQSFHEHDGSQPCATDWPMRAANGKALTNDFIVVYYEVERGMSMFPVANVFEDWVNECACDVVGGAWTGGGQDGIYV